jgi:adenylate kinase family enzyme
MQKRIVTYNEHTLPIINYYAERKLVFEVDGTQTPDAVYADVAKIFQEANFPPLIHS